MYIYIYLTNEKKKKKTVFNRNLHLSKISSKPKSQQKADLPNHQPENTSTPHHLQLGGLLGYNSAQGLGQKLRMAKALDDSMRFFDLFPRKKKKKNSETSKNIYIYIYKKKRVCLLNVARLVSLNRILDLEPKKGGKNG